MASQMLAEGQQFQEFADGQRLRHGAAAAAAALRTGASGSLGKPVPPRQQLIPHQRVHDRHNRCLQVGNREVRPRRAERC